MAAGAFTDKAHKPSPSELHKTMGTMREAWDDLIAFIRETYQAQEDFAFLYGKPYGWGMRFRRRGKLLTALYPAESGFTVQIILNPEAVERASKIRAVCVREAIARAKPYAEGRWLFVRVKSAGDVAAVQRLLELKTGVAKSVDPME